MQEVIHMGYKSPKNNKTNQIVGEGTPKVLHCPWSLYLENIQAINNDGGIVTGDLLRISRHLLLANNVTLL